MKQIITVCANHAFYSTDVVLEVMVNPAPHDGEKVGHHGGMTSPRHGGDSRSCLSLVSRAASLNKRQAHGFIFSHTMEPWVMSEPRS